jgi:hypothetical protein
MTTELRDFIKAGSARIKERDKWLNRLHAEPATATGFDVRKLVERIRGLEAALNDYYRECECMAGVVIAKKMQEATA